MNTGLGAPVAVGAPGRAVVTLTAPPATEAVGEAPELRFESDMPAVEVPPAQTGTVRLTPAVLQRSLVKAIVTADF